MQIELSQIPFVYNNLNYDHCIFEKMSFFPQLMRFLNHCLIILTSLEINCYVM